MHADLTVEHFTTIVELHDGGRSSFRLRVQGDAIGQVLNQLSALLSDVDCVFIHSPSKEGDRLGPGVPWLELFRPFTAIKALCVGDELSSQIALALESVTSERAAVVLPTLKVRKLFNYRYNSGDERHHGLFSRAVVVPGSAAFETLLGAIHGTSMISLYGFYCHAGHAYGSTSPSQASSFLTSEVETVNKAAKMALDRLLGSPGGKIERPPFVLSIGATPTAHCASAETRARLQSLLHGTLELHAGEYAVINSPSLS